MTDSPSGSSGKGWVVLYGSTIFLAAALLFMVQPMVGRMVLPRFGGSPEVWNTSMVFFQLALLAGYAYAHFTVGWMGVKRQAILHGLILLLPLVTLPIVVPEWTLPRGEWQPPWLLLLLTGAVGAPFFVLATASPLLQRWFAATGHEAGRDPYFLYAGSNAGSLLGLLAYPFLIEPFLPLGLQSRVWTGGYVLFLLLVLACGLPMILRGDRTADGDSASGPYGLEPAGVDPAVDPAERRSPKDKGEGPGRLAGPASPERKAFWVLLAFVPSSLLLAVTHYLSTEVAAIPLLWVLPLAVYLITYIVAFSPRLKVSTGLSSRILVVSAVALALTFLARIRDPVWTMVLLHLTALAAAGLLCHGRLAETRPPARKLTGFYLLISVGGVLGGAFNALAAPVLFDNILEYPLILVVASAVAVYRGRDGGMMDWLAPLGLIAVLIAARAIVDAFPDISDQAVALLSAIPVLILYLFSKHRVRFTLGLAVILAFAFFLPVEPGQRILEERTFFGVSRVMEDQDENFRILFHGTTVHGVQSTDPSLVDTALGYYHDSQPGGWFIDQFARNMEGMEMAVIGLGTGALAIKAGGDDRVTFFEIDPAVVEIAEDPAYFSYLSRTPAEYDIQLGDGRIAMEETERDFDLIILDAFSSASVPIHLLTREALQLYMDHLRPGGVLMFHISSRHLELAPVVAAIGADAGLDAAEAPPYEDPDRLLDGVLPSHWVALARRTEDFLPYVDGRWRPLSPSPDTRVWTDDYADVLSVYRWN